MVANHRTVQVFSFSFPDPTVEMATMASFKATREAIRNRFGGMVLEGTGQLVDERELDGEGRFRRLATGWGELPP